MNIEVQRMYRFETDRPLKAFVDIIINDALLVKGCRVMEGKTGLFVSMPREQAKDKKWYDTVRCLTQEVRDHITRVILETYLEDSVSELTNDPSSPAFKEDEDNVEIN
jgi:stage V sporulation protein G